MPEFLPYIKNAAIHSRITDPDHSALEITYQNSHEPFKWSLYKIRLERPLYKHDWDVRWICSFNPESERYEDIGHLYADGLVEQIASTVLHQLNRKKEMAKKDII